MCSLASGRLGRCDSARLRWIRAAWHNNRRPRPHQASASSQSSLQRHRAPQSLSEMCKYNRKNLSNRKTESTPEWSRQCLRRRRWKMWPRWTSCHIRWGPLKRETSTSKRSRVTWLRRRQHWRHNCTIRSSSRRKRRTMCTLKRLRVRKQSRPRKRWQNKWRNLLSSQINFIIRTLSRKSRVCMMRRLTCGRKASSTAWSSNNRRCSHSRKIWPSWWVCSARPVNMPPKWTMTA